MIVRNGESTYNVPEGTKIVVSNEPVEVDTFLEWKEPKETKPVLYSGINPHLWSMF